MSSGELIVGKADFGQDGSARFSVTVPAPPEDDGWSFLLPSAEPPGAARLAAEGAIVAGRFRADRALDFARLVASGQELDRLFKLKSRLFSSAILEGTWELAIYMPPEASEMPLIALALDLKHRGPAIAASEEFLDQIEKQWNLRRSPYQQGEHTGACFRDLRVLPELAPCYVFLENSLIVGWNVESLEHAGRGQSDPLAAEVSRLVVRLDLFTEAEERLTRAVRSRLVSPPEDLLAPQVYPWSSLSITGRREGGGYVFAAELR